MSIKKFNLSTSNPIQQFIFSTPTSWLEVVRATIVNPEITNHDTDWSRLISNYYLEIKLSYTVDKEKKLESTQVHPILFLVDAYQVQPIIEINQQFKTGLVSINNPTDKFYTDLYIKLVQRNADNSRLELSVVYNEFQLKEIQ